MTIYKLVSENLTNLGLTMGSEYTFPNWVRYFDSLAKAKKVAEEDFAKSSKNKITWKREKNYIHSGDLMWVMYNITKIKVE
jgi:hypothetical protein